MSSRGARISDVLTNEDVNEIADAEAGIVPKAIEQAAKPKKEGDTAGATPPTSVAEKPTAIHVATVGQNGKVQFEDAKELKDFVGR